MITFKLYSNEEYQAAPKSLKKNEVIRSFDKFFEYTLYHAPKKIAKEKPHSVAKAYASVFLVSTNAYYQSIAAKF